MTRFSRIDAEQLIDRQARGKSDHPGTRSPLGARRFGQLGARVLPWKGPSPQRCRSGIWRPVRVSLKTTSSLFDLR